MTDRLNSSPDPTDRDQATGERRRDDRREYHVGINVQVDTAEFAGRTQNVSQAGVFFFSGDQLCVTVELEQDGERVRRKGHLVRVERMNAETTGFAIEFDQH
jgi:hypothetical protein